MNISGALLAVPISCYSAVVSLGGAIAGFLECTGSPASSWHVRERRSLPCAADALSVDRSRVWIHAASLGETRLLCEFLEVLRRKQPDLSYVLTATTWAGVEYLRAHAVDRSIVIGLFPLDTIPLMGRFVARFGVSRVWLMETELWPAMLWVCMARGIPVGIANARLEERSFRAYRMVKWLVSPLLKHLDMVLAQDRLYAERFEQLGVPPGRTRVTGNMKGRVRVRRPSRESVNDVRRAMGLNGSARVVTVGCVHPVEASVIAGAAKMLADNGQAWKWILVPRHLGKTDTILREVGPMVHHTKGLVAPAHGWDMCVVEALGVLEDLYMIADAAVLGGTFVEVGGHNVWEAAQFGIPVFFGPSYFSQRESCERLLAAGVGFCAGDARELSEELWRVLGTDSATAGAAMESFIAETNRKSQSFEGTLP